MEVALKLPHREKSQVYLGDRLASPVINAPVGQLAQAVTLSLWRSWVRIPSGVQLSEYGAIWQTRMTKDHMPSGLRVRLPLFRQVH